MVNPESLEQRARAAEELKLLNEEEAKMAQRLRQFQPAPFMGLGHGGVVSATRVQYHAMCQLNGLRNQPPYIIYQSV